MRTEIKQPIGLGVGTYKVPCPGCGEMVLFEIYGCHNYKDKRGIKWWYSTCSCGKRLKVGPTVKPLVVKLIPIRGVMLLNFVCMDCGQSFQEEVDEETTVVLTDVQADCGGETLLNVCPECRKLAAR